MISSYGVCSMLSGYWKHIHAHRNYAKHRRCNDSVCIDICGVFDRFPNPVIRAGLKVLSWRWRLISPHLHVCVLQRYFSNLPSMHALLEATVSRLWPASSASAPLSPVWSAFFGQPRLFERQVLGVVAGFAGV